MKDRTLVVYISDHTYRSHVSQLLSAAGHRVVAPNRPESPENDVSRFDPYVIVAVLGRHEADVVITECWIAAATRPAG